MAAQLINAYVVQSRDYVTAEAILIESFVDYLSERMCFLSLKQIQNTMIVTFQSISSMSPRNREDSFEASPHTPDQALCLLLTDTFVIAGPTRPGFG